MVGSVLLREGMSPAQICASVGSSCVCPSRWLLPPEPPADSVLLAECGAGVSGLGV